ncbi:MAG: 50S ribosomal protein L15 [Patescibacteria group bacterium]
MSLISLHTLSPYHGSRKERRRVGRGGKRGTTSGRGTKGQRARTGGRNKLAYKGMRHILLQTPQLRGHANKPKDKYVTVNIGTLSELFDDGAIITAKSLQDKGVIRALGRGLKILGDGELNKKFEITAHAFSASAKEKIEKARGRAIIVEKYKIQSSNNK